MKQNHVSQRHKVLLVATQVGAVVAGVLASVCCWLPPLLLVFGLSSGTLAARFSAWRPVLLPVMFALLALAFVLTYWKPRRSDAEAECCSIQAHKTGKLSKGLLWLALIGTVALAIGSDYIPASTGAGKRTARGSAPVARTEWVLHIKGMTCLGCANHVEAKLRNLPGVQDASVDLRKGEAVLHSDSTVTADDLKRSVKTIGYSVASVQKRTLNGGQK